MCINLLPFILLFAYILVDSFSAPLSTVDRLKIDHTLPDAFIEQENAKCNMSKLCTYDEMNVKTICGTDGRTYNSFCEIKRAICHGNPVEKKLEGPCPESLRCLLERSFQQNLAAEKLNSSEIFIPECNASDGSYANVQCHKSTGYCWCVTRMGRPLPSTSIRNARPNCQLAYTPKVERRSHRKSNRESLVNDVCSTLDRSTFNANLFQLFKNEYERAADPEGDLTIALDKRIISWKFGELDTNNDEVLSTKEIVGFRRLVRKLAQPKACARKFPRYCDLDKNKEISSREWTTCLGLDLTTSYGMFNALRSNSSTNHASATPTRSYPSSRLRGHVPFLTIGEQEFVILFRKTLQLISAILCGTRIL
ncbi:Sparc-related modular calcium-binding protein 1 [Toxocara canis]|uniref:Sparc-related modular calcium-binding protein 1 n=1 Tax=Toxocara canis TaxID=6265 RepID=A0A0B2VH62_TOXCA|nr:Sparc-related modular calcium-binding protein 1 [Toxocara canis]